MQLGDGIGTITLNSKAKDAGSEELAAFFDYINKQSIPKDDSLIKELHKKVREFNSEKWRRMVRTLYDEIEDEKRYSFNEGKAEGISEGKLKERKIIAKNLKASGMKLTEIAVLTSLSQEEIKKL